MNLEAQFVSNEFKIGLINLSAQFDNKILLIPLKRLLTASRLPAIIFPPLFLKLSIPFLIFLFRPLQFRSHTKKKPDKTRRSGAWFHAKRRHHHHACPTQKWRTKFPSFHTITNTSPARFPASKSYYYPTTTAAAKTTLSSTTL